MITDLFIRLNGSSILWTRSKHSVDIDHALVNSSMLDKISSADFVDFLSVSDHKPLEVYCKKTTTDESFLLSNKKKKFVRWDRYKCLELKKEIWDHNKFEILSEELGNKVLSADSIVEKFINITNSGARNLSITSSTEVRKAMFRMSRKIYYYLQKVKHIKYKQIKSYKSSSNSNEFVKIVGTFNRLCESIHKKCNEFKKKDYLYWIKIGWHYKFLGSDSTGHSLSKDFWKDL